MKLNRRIDLSGRLKIQGEVVVDASQAESALDRVGNEARSMAAGVGKSAGQAGKAVDGIGEQSETGAQKFTRAEARMRDSIRKSTQSFSCLSGISSLETGWRTK